MRLGSLMRVSEYWGGDSRVMLRWRSEGGEMAVGFFNFEKMGGKIWSERVE